VANGEVYNHKLGIGDDEFGTQSDSEIVLLAHSRLNSGVCDRLLGMLAGNISHGRKV